MPHETCWDAVYVQEHFSNLVDNSGGFDGWVAEGLPVDK
jgi:rhodanese-related sulfurtransferase